MEKVFNILENTGTNWSVNKLPLVTECGKKTGSYGIFRNDNGNWLGTVRERYEPYQNSQLAELIVTACETLDLDVTRGGILKDGAKVFYQVPLQDEFIGKSGVKRYITALNSHDGSTSIGLGSSNTVIVCQNTFYKAYREMEKVKHTASAKFRMEMMRDNLKATIENDNLLMDQFKRMAEIELKDEMIERVINKIFKIDSKNEKVTDVSTRRQNQIQSFAGALNTEIKLEGKTIWGLFNAVTRYTNHIAAPSDEQAKIEYLMQGTGKAISNLAFDELMKFVERNSHEYVMIEK